MSSSSSQEVEQTVLESITTLPAIVIDPTPEPPTDPQALEEHDHAQSLFGDDTILSPHSTPDTRSYHSDVSKESDIELSSAHPTEPLDSKDIVNQPHLHSPAPSQVPHTKSPFKDEPSKAIQEWNKRKSQHGEANTVLDVLMEYQGLEEVKQQFLDIKSKVDCCKEQGRDIKSERFNIVFQGNPGTGKTTLARLYARFLHSLGILDSDYIKETTGIKIATGGVSKLKRKIKNMLRRKGGGVLFVDEAYQLVAPYASDVGRAALDLVLTAMENNIGKLVVIFVGYKEEMESFFEHNPGLSSRIPYNMRFADFTNAELWKVLYDNITRQYNGKMQVEDGMDGLYMRIAIRRLAQTRGSRSFGNARAVQNLLARISQRQSQRLAREKRCNGEPDCFFFTKEDIIGPDPATAAQESEPLVQLKKLIGLSQVKECVQSMIRMIQLNYRRELRERPPLKFSLNQLFVGNPGTGKTTVAKLYGQILADLGYLSNGEVVLKNPADFIGECLGKSEMKTKKILDATVGKILVIDEAYMLDAGDPHEKQDKFKTGVIDTIVSLVQGVPGEDRCIILIGYENKIRDMFHNVNPGLSRRFPIERPFRFENFDILQLEQILRLKMKEQELEYTEHAVRVAREVLERSLLRPNFTNAGEVDSLLSTAKMNYEMRLSRMPLDCLDVDMEVVATDFDPDYDRGSRIDCRKLMGGLVHSTIIDKLAGYQRQCSGARKYNINPRDQVPTRFIFKGPPGTGKTTTAQKMGELFHGMGFIATPEVIECSVADLIGQYVGHTIPKTRKKLQEGVGRVLFIDEAYRLMYGEYAAEAVDEMIQFLTQTEHKGKMIVILAGYEADINALMSIRMNLASLFPEEIIFKNIPPEDCIALLDRELELNKFTSTAGFLADSNSEDYRKVKRLFRVMQSIPCWSNARDVRNLSRRIIGKFLESTDQSSIDPTQILSPDNIIDSMWEMITQQKDRCIARGSTDNVYSPQQPPIGGADSGPGLLNPQLASPPPPTSAPPPTFDICTPGAGHNCTTNNDVSIETRSSGHSHSSLSQANAMSTRIDGPRGSGGMPRGSPDDEGNREYGVSEDIWQELLQAKRSENIRRKRDLQEAIRSGNDENGDALRDRLSFLQQQIRGEQRTQEALVHMDRCVMGYAWNRVAGGYRCDGGTHFITDAEVQLNLG
ncbi:P-loop containing nucleoside triphosphate hydrolase protein [Annulohypoxylon moriforme]|nr:P-loop containing nucleoside triphosphate hydrolase protein [Annulohypoxylon moriforme]